MRLNEELAFKQEVVQAMDKDLRDEGLDPAALLDGVVAGGPGEGAPPARVDPNAGGTPVLDTMRCLAEAESRKRQATASAAHATLCPSCLKVDEEPPAKGVAERACPHCACASVSTVKCRVPAPSPGQALLPCFAPPADATLAALLQPFAMPPTQLARLPKLLGEGMWEVDAARVGRWLFATTLVDRPVVATTAAEAQRLAFEAAVALAAKASDGGGGKGGSGVGGKGGKGGKGGGRAPRVRAPAAQSADLDVFFAPLRVLEAKVAADDDFERGGPSAGGAGTAGGGGGGRTTRRLLAGDEDGGGAEVVDPLARLHAARLRLLRRRPRGAKPVADPLRERLGHG